MSKLLEVSAVRKLEKELLSERKAQRELEAEKEKYAGKESFVTGAYKTKMAELRELVEKRRQEEAREDIMDVTKQDGLGGFYRYMYEQKTEPKLISKSQKDVTEKVCELVLFTILWGFIFLLFYNSCSQFYIIENFG